MKINEMKMRMGMIMTQDEIKRVKLQVEKCRVGCDLHGLTVKAAKRLINNLIAIDRGACELELIHGYNHGTALKSMIRGSLNNPRVAGERGVNGNPGVTILDIRAAA